MSEMEHRKITLSKVLDSENNPVNMQDYLEMEYSVYCDEEISQEDAFWVLTEFLEEQDFKNNYYLYENILYKIVREKDYDPYGYVEVSLVGEDIEVDALWYNGGGSLREVLEDGLNNFKKESDDENSV